MNIVIIGAGVAGLSIGWRLQQAGASVTVIERAQAGRGATWASAGMIAATAEMGESEGPAAQLSAYSAALWADFPREIEDASGVSIGFRRDGTMIVARSEVEAARLRDRTSDVLQFLPGNEARKLEPLLAPNIHGALLDPTEAQVDNRALGSALAIAFRRAGGVLQINEAVVRLEIENGRAVAARTPFHLYGADAFVLAAGAWSARVEGLPPEAAPPIIPVKGEMIALQPGRETPPSHMIWGDDIYMLSRHGRLMVGATVARQGYDTATTDEAARWLYDRAVSLLPAAGKWVVVEHWAGLRPGSPDDLPLIGASALDGLFIASGQFRNGILFAPAIAETMRTILLDHTVPDSVRAFDPRRFTDGQVL
jgi:glycine oxidase